MLTNENGPVQNPDIPSPRPRGQSIRRHYDDESIDEVSIVTMPRYKTSGMSGDEWRTSVRLEFRRKGVTIWHRTFSGMDAALAGIAWFRAIMHEGPDGKDEGQFHRAAYNAIEAVACQQPGCSEPFINTFRFKTLQISPQSSVTEPANKYGSDDITRFCARHSRRGDCGIEDCDENLERLAGSGFVAEHAEDESPSMTQTVHVDINDPDMLAAIKAAVDAARGAK